MSGDGAEPRSLFGVVLGDANVLYSRVLRDYLLYAMTHQLIRLMWSDEILDEVVTHLVENIHDFDEAAGRRLMTAMNDTFPHARVALTRSAIAAVEGYALVDEDDRHVLAAAVAAEAAFLCSNDRAGFPDDVMTALGIRAITSDELLGSLIEEAPSVMLRVHRTVVGRLPGATDESTIAALRAAQAHRSAALVANMLRCSGERH